MKRLAIYSLISILIMIVVSCENTVIDTATQYGSIEGYVLDAQTNTPVAGVNISTNPASAAYITDSSGKFVIDKVVAGDIAITGKKDNYTSSTVSVHVTLDQKTYLQMILMKDMNIVQMVDLNTPSPGNQALGQDTLINLTWKATNSNTNIKLTYSVYIYKANSTVRINLGEDLEDASAWVGELEYDTAYFWFVTANYDGKRVGISPTWSFRTKTRPTITTQ
ncbi:MAG: carboxypeptidase regulatory-like domain-containing protein [Bacteroidota bacterium]|nr:carboxypeptidase regulatory-like domain-containing protein [Bacteroidota bacterium]MDP4206599.1 carboxypeptidase regulatory-like domain-containing protein [Bacteroidota bacterium]